MIASHSDVGILLSGASRDHILIPFCTDMRAVPPIVHLTPGPLFVSLRQSFSTAKPVLIRRDRCNRFDHFDNARRRRRPSIDGAKRMSLSLELK